MKDTTMAKYNGQEYSAGIKVDGRIVLRSDNPDDISKGFELYQIGNNKIYIKYVSREEIDGIYDIVTTANYQGYSFEVIDADGDKILLCTMKLDYRICENLRMECIDKGVYQKWINKREAKIKVKKEML